MYICVCKAVTDHRIRQAVQEGACTVRDLQMSLGLGTGCGKCVPSAREVLASSLAPVIAPVQGAGVRGAGRS
jgi:bacterioferritin-associated ferredoxin